MVFLALKTLDLVTKVASSFFAQIESSNNGIFGF
jgi:hypothetical protein